jgi:hypothetical protein
MVTTHGFLDSFVEGQGKREVSRKKTVILTVPKIVSVPSRRRNVIYSANYATQVAVETAAQPVIP